MPTSKNILNSNTEISQLHAIATKLKTNFKKIGVHTIADLPWYFPYRYDDLSKIKQIADITANELLTVKVKIEKINSHRSWKQKMMITEITATDGKDKLKAVWFRQKFVAQILKVGDNVYFSGKAQLKNSTWQFINPTYEKVKNNPLHSARLVPIYKLSGRITQKQLRFLIHKVLKEMPATDDPLPVDILNKEKYLWLHESLQEIHFPSNQKRLKQATERLKFQELFYLQIKYQLAKQNYQKQPSFRAPLDDKLINAAVSNLPFKLTLDQQKALYDILADLGRDCPMNRLIEGDVGSGKTVVAFLSALNTMSNGWQTTFMAPTEILAEQHFINSQSIFPKKYHKNIALVTKNNYRLANNKIISKRELLKKISNKEVTFIIGTHALIQDKIDFNDLALVIIDEQHRFGVNQRKSLKDKNKTKKVPHLLSMTATPIPRTLALTLYGDLDISLIQEKPAGRQEIKTFLVPEKKRTDAYNFIKDKIKNKEQVFVICPLIDESDKLGVKSVTAEYKKLNENIFPALDIRMIHGKLKSEEKEEIMSDFKNNKFPILVATSVIEVGVDIPRATIMLIESAERFGLSQLHQFRGRVGRNDLESFCMLFTTDKSQQNTKRLKALIKTNDGFKLSELDLELRGAGEIFGTKQTGLMKLKIAKLTDIKLIKKAQNWAQKILSSQKYLSQKQIQIIIKDLKQTIHLE